MTTITLVALKTQGKLVAGDTINTPRLGDCKVLRIHDVRTIDVEASNGNCFRLSAVNFGPDARMIDKP